jgi:hypothetical protein
MESIASSFDSNCSKGIFSNELEQEEISSKMKCNINLGDFIFFIFFYLIEIWNTPRLLKWVLVFTYVAFSK